jgi:hypothetical protein
VAPSEGSSWPESVQQITGRVGLSANAKRKMLGENALRLCPRLKG